MVFIFFKTALSYLGETFVQAWNNFENALEQFPKQNCARKFFFERIILLKITTESIITIIDNDLSYFNDPVGRFEKKYPEKKSVETKLAFISFLEEIESFSESEKRKESFSAFLSDEETAKYRAKLLLKKNNLKSKVKELGIEYQLYSRRAFLNRFARGSATAFITLLSLGTGGIAGLFSYLELFSRNLEYKKDGLAILISFELGKLPKITKDIGEKFIFAYVQRLEIAFGQKANIVKPAATKEDFINALKNDQIQNIVLFGHGSNDCWNATDQDVLAVEITQRDDLKNIRKKGLLVRHTCGTNKKIKVEGWYFTLEFQKFFSMIEKINALLNKKIHLCLTIELTKMDSHLANAVYLEISVSKEFLKRIRYPLEPNDEKTLFQDKKETSTEIIVQVRISHFVPPNVDYLPFSKIFHSLSEEACRKLKEFFIAFRMYRDSHRKQETVPLPILGFPIFKQENIKGWNRTAYPEDFILHVFGENDEPELDNLYKLAKIEKDSQEK